MTSDYYIYQKIFLLLLKDKEGTVFSSVFYHQALSGALIADLLLSKHIEIEENKRSKKIRLLNTSPIGDDLLDECLLKLYNAKRITSIQTWVSRFSALKNMKHRAAESLCRAGILNMQEETILLLFKRKVYPEINPVPEKRIMDKLYRAIFTDDDNIEADTIILLALCKSTNILGKIFDRKEIRSRKARINQIVKGEIIGQATMEVIQSVQAAITIAAVMPAIIASTTASS